MKLFSGALAAVVLAAAMATGCSESPHRYSEIKPSIRLGPARTLQVGESARLTATTENLVGARAINWTVTPNVGRVRVENDSSGQTAIFSADQPGVYVITASADLGNGGRVASDTTVTVNGRPLTSDRVPEPAPRDVAPANRP